jgi:hypothetical protein
MDGRSGKSTLEQRHQELFDIFGTVDVPVHPPPDMEAAGSSFPVKMAL